MKEKYLTKLLSPVHCDAATDSASEINGGMLLIVPKETESPSLHRYSFNVPRLHAKVAGVYETEFGIIPRLEMQMTAAHKLSQQVMRRFAGSRGCLSHRFCGPAPHPPGKPRVQRPLGYRFWLTWPRQVIFSQPFLLCHCFTLGPPIKLKFRSAWLGNPFALLDCACLGLGSFGCSGW